MRWRHLVLAQLVGLLVVAMAEAGPCTRGVNCYCDRVKGGDLNDPALLVCEDFEAPTLVGNVGAGNGAPNFGPPYDSPSGFSGFRGGNSYFQRTYGGCGAGCWPNGQPASPRHGSTCNVGSGNTCGLAVWHPTDLWNGNNWAVAAFLQNGQFNAELGSITPPTGASGGGSGVFDGGTVLANRIEAGRGNTGGIFGAATFPRGSEIGITMALAYSSNLGATRILESPWKHDEFEHQEHWNLGLTGTAGPAQYPYSPVRFTTSQSACNSALSRATVHVGTADCTDAPALRYGASSARYVQSRDFPWGTWGCHQAHMSGMGTSNMTIRVWHNGVLLIHISGLDGRSNVFPYATYGTMAWNNYANANQGLGETPTTQIAFRYQDNVHVRAGAPVSCAQIGFTAGGGTPPAAPSGLTVR
jgi:hypothetical protein